MEDLKHTLKYVEQKKENARCGVEDPMTPNNSRLWQRTGAGILMNHQKESGATLWILTKDGIIAL